MDGRTGRPGGSGTWGAGGRCAAVAVVAGAGLPGGRLEPGLEGRYVWLRGFGNRNYKGGPLEFEDFEGAAAALREKLAGGGPANVILMCACRDLKTCHRKEVAERLSKEWGGMVAHLETPGGPAADEPKKRRSVLAFLASDVLQLGPGFCTGALPVRKQYDGLSGTVLEVIVEKNSRCPNCSSTLAAGDPLWQ